VSERGSRATGESRGSVAASVRRAAVSGVRAAASAGRRVAARLGRVASSAGARALGGAHGRAGVVPRDAGMATAEYAIATIAAVGFAGLLVVVLRSGEVQELLAGIIRRALTV
jgi:Protein of unknown function (DUF4244)